MGTYLVVALFDDNEQRTAIEVEATSPTKAEEYAQGQAVLANNDELGGKEPEDVPRAQYVLKIAGVIRLKPASMVVVA
jgi:hypothetical protein